MEKLIERSAFPNPGHKNRLRRRLFEEPVELFPEELDAAAGGVALPEENKREPLQ